MFIFFVLILFIPNNKLTYIPVLWYIHYKSWKIIIILGFSCICVEQMMLKVGNVGTIVFDNLCLRNQISRVDQYLLAPKKSVVCTAAKVIFMSVNINSLRFSLFIIKSIQRDCNHCSVSLLQKCLARA